MEFQEDDAPLEEVDVDALTVLSAERALAQERNLRVNHPECITLTCWIPPFGTVGAITCRTCLPDEQVLVLVYARRNGLWYGPLLYPQQAVGVHFNWFQVEEWATMPGDTYAVDAFRFILVSATFSPVPVVDGSAEDPVLLFSNLGPDVLIFPYSIAAP